MTNEQLDLLLALTSIRSDTLIAAIRAVRVEGQSQKAAAAAHDVHEGLLSRRLAALREVESTVMQLAKFYQEE